MAGWRIGIYARRRVFWQGASRRQEARQRFVCGAAAFACRCAGSRLRRIDHQPPAKISPKSYASAEQALRAGLDDLNAGNAASCVDALTYAAEGGQTVARWKLGEMYADGVGVARDDVKAYHYFNQLVQDYDEDALDPRNRGAVSSAFVAVGVYSLTGIPNSDVRPDPERARELFQYAAATFGDPDAQYNLAHMYIVGSGGLAKDKLVAVRWLMLALGKRPPSVSGAARSPAVCRRRRPAATGAGTDVAHHRQRRRGKSEGRLDRDLYRRDLAAASAQDREMATAMLDERAKGPPRLRRSPAPSSRRFRSCGRSAFRCWPPRRRRRLLRRGRLRRAE